MGLGIGEDAEQRGMANASPKRQVRNQLVQSFSCCANCTFTRSWRNCLQNSRKQIGTRPFLLRQNTLFLPYVKNWSWVSNLRANCVCRQDLSSVRHVLSFPELTRSVLSSPESSIAVPASAIHLFALTLVACASSILLEAQAQTLFICCYACSNIQA